MLRHPLLLFFVCLALFLTAYEASAKPRQTDTAEYQTKSTKVAKSKSKAAAVAKKDTAKSSGNSSAVASAKKSSPKQAVKGSPKVKYTKAKNTNSRKNKKPSRDLATLPSTDEDFDETPHSVLTALSAIPADGNLSSPFGPRRIAKKTRRSRMHTGIDISVERGSPVLAAASGVVCFVGRWSAYGKIVEIDHGNGLVTRYAHLDRYTVEEGDKVASGEHIGDAGRTGRTTGAHLHFETLVNGRAVNPMMAEMWQQTPEQLAAKRGTYVSGLRSATHVY